MRINRTREVLRRPLGLPSLLSILFLNCLAPAHAIEPLVLLPASGQGLVVMNNTDNGSILAEALIRRAAVLYDWLLPDILPY